MRKSKCSESQIVKVLKSVEAGRQVRDVCRELGIAEATYYVWKQKYGGIKTSDVRRLRDLESENAKLKHMFADLALENTALKRADEAAATAGAIAEAADPLDVFQAGDTAPETPETLQAVLILRSRAIRLRACNLPKIRKFFLGFSSFFYILSRSAIPDGI